MGKYISIDWATYLADPNYWQRISNDKSIPLHISMNREEL